ncbi:hypothetical protein PR202_gb18725 [Eleusine coracana subsp. coracana]|uniref:Glutaredoxin domain-containing protein n=1 Tax=Eleusine coracana subsp. coracana TaxID=191504 RepID=A0AAV5F421_ELECO|nr:hypothetical protein QOZ80_3BG0292700 [Eleusine coracana subsp. coracana]GJN30419.1 hypothetical protein PR202_gb18725 [Eleusine coracana subsp. coracana]
MGCTTSRQARHDLRYCPSPLALPRSQSFPARCPSDLGAAHVVRLTSSTLGSLDLLDKAAFAPTTRLAAPPRTPTMTPPNEPEAIDAWALMAGLEDHQSPLLSPFGRHSFSFPVVPPPAAPHDLAAASAKVTPLPMLPTTTSPPAAVTNGGGGEEEEEENKATKAAAPPRRAVLYFTSLRGVRSTYEDCCLARGILKGYGVRVDERDVSMHRGFRDELDALLLGPGRKCWARPVLLPSLFVDGELVGHAEEVKRLHEAGELAARLDGCEGEAGACQACGDVRFVLCEVCSGSCKVYVDDEEYPKEEEDDDVSSDGSGGGRFRRCRECNENGIVRCPACCCC